jgi:TolB-like protein
MSRHCLILRVVALLSGLFCFAPRLFADPPSISAPQPGVYVVFPFENSGAGTRLDWLREGLEELTVQKLSAAGEQVYTHEGRTSELERNGFPFAAKLSRATMLRIAQDLDADYVIFGSFNSDGKSLTVESRVLRVEPASLLAPVKESASLDSLMELHTKLVWQLLNSIDRPYRLSLTDFSKAQHPLRLDAFEHYVRGLMATEDQARLRGSSPIGPIRTLHWARPISLAMIAPQPFRCSRMFRRRTGVTLRRCSRWECAGSK